MRLHRFIGDYDLSAGQVTAKDATLANQLANVFRLGTGDKVLLCDGKGSEATCTVDAIDKGSVSFSVGTIVPVSTEPHTQVTLYAALLKKENFELTVQKAVEAGAVRIVPVVTRRTVPQAPRMDRLGKIAREAAEQCGRGVVPAVHEPMTLAMAIADAQSCDERYVCDFGGKDARVALAHPHGTIAVLVGPEGGFDQEEVLTARKEGFAAIDLGARTLRAETASIIVTWLAAR